MNAAIYSKDRKYRYALTRVWDIHKPMVLFIMLNPSKANAIQNDPTITRVIGFSKRWGFGKVVVCNLFAYCATQPTDLFKQKKPIGKFNDYWIGKFSKEAHQVILAYGNHGNFQERHLEILKRIDQPFCIKISLKEMPMHPLYLKYTTTPLPFKKSDSRIQSPQPYPN